MLEMNQKKISRRKALLQFGAASFGLSTAMLLGKSMPPAQVLAQTIAGSLPHITIDQLRNTAEAAPDTIYYLTDYGQQGFFQYDPRDTRSNDNGGTILVSRTGLRFKRITEESILNVSWFGAKGNGSADDTAAIQRTIEAANAEGGGVIFLPKGNYLITAALRFYSHTVIKGAGVVSTQLINTGTDYCFKPADAGQVTRNVSFTQFRITGNPSNAGGILVQNCYNCLFQSLELTRVPKIGIKLYGTVSGCNWNNIIQCHFISDPTSSHAIHISENNRAYSPNANKIHQCIIAGGTVGLEITSADTNVISETGFNDTTGSWLINGGRYNRFIANRYENSARPGGGIQLTSTSAHNMHVAETYSGAPANQHFVDQGTLNAQLNVTGPYGPETSISSLTARSVEAPSMAATRFRFAPANNTNDTFEVLPHPTFGGAIMRIYSDSTKSQENFTLNKLGNLTTRGFVDAGTGRYIRFPNLASPPSSPAPGTVYYDTRTNKLKLWTGSRWETITSS